jgi:hypothetical protein
MFLIITCLLALLYIVIVIYAYRLNNLLGILPTLSWLAFMVAPFLFSFKYFDLRSTNYQLIGIILIGLALILGDLFCVSKQSKRVDTEYQKIDVSTKFLIVISLFVVLVPIIHLILAGNSPLFDLIFSNRSKNEISNERAFYSKFEISYIFSILSNLTINIFMPILLAIQIYYKKYYLFIITLVYAVIYALNSTAKLPFISLIFALVIVLGSTIRPKYKRVIGLLALTCFGLTILSGVLFGNAMIKNKELCSVPINISDSPANISRSCPEYLNLGINPVINTIGYRVFLTPVEVSNHWYEFFLDDQNSFRGMQSFLERDTYKKTANIIGIKYYKEPFPNSYGSSVSAYSSIDADAFSFGGLGVVAIASLLLLLIRIYIGLSKNNSPPITKILEALSLNLIIILPFSASIQAILLPHGLMLLLFSIFFLRNFISKKV